jgi:hypothetical protein
MKCDMACYRDKYEHGFVHYLRRTKYVETIEGDLDRCAEAAVNLARGILGLLIGLPLIALRATILWPASRAYEYVTNKQKLRELVGRDKERSASPEPKEESK